MKRFTDEQIIIALESSKEAAETDEVRDFLDDVIECINRKDAEIIRLKGSVVTNNIMEIVRIKKQAKSNAIKEFAERLKEHSFVDNLSLNGKETVYVEDIDRLVKEMTEVQE